LLNSRPKLMQEGIFLVFIHKSFQFRGVQSLRATDRGVLLLTPKVSIPLYGENQQKFLANKKER
jgi:hypothetical protein